MNLRTSETVVFSANKEVIVATGTYNTPKLLMLSGIGPANVLQNFGIPVVVDVPGVGKNLRDHYSAATYWQTSLEPNTPFAFQTPVFNMFGPEPAGPTTFQFDIAGTYGSVVPLRAKSVGTVTIKSKLPEDAPVIDPMILSDDIITVISGIRNILLPLFKNLMTKNVIIRGITLDPNRDYTDAELIEFVKNSLDTAHHPVGTAKMGAVDTDLMAVVNSKFKVRGVSGLRVVDASIFPKTPSANIHTSVVMAALKAVDEIKHMEKLVNY